MEPGTLRGGVSRWNDNGLRTLAIRTSHKSALHRIEVIESPVRISETGELTAPFEEAIGTPGEFVGDQRREQVNGRHGLGLRLPRRVSSTPAMPPRRS